MMKTGIMILLMAAGILTATLNSTTGPEDEERNQELEDILRTPTFNNSTLTNSTREFDDVDEDILEEELSDAETNSSNMSKLQIALWVCVAILALLASLVIFIFVVKGRKERSEAQAIKDQDKRQEKIEGLSIAKRDH